MTTPEKIQIWLGIVTIGAVVLGPILALCIQSTLNRRREKKERKLHTFRLLMATRGTALSASHVEALNAIEVEFYGQSRPEKEVVQAGRIYLDHLGTSQQEQANNWAIQRVDLLTDLLHKMAICLGYEFDKVRIKNNAYVPIGHGNIERDLELIRTGLVQLLSGKLPIKMEVVSLPSTVSESDLLEQKEIRSLPVNYLEGKIPMPVTILNAPELK
jgi:hypothetical protein